MFHNSEHAEARFGLSDAGNIYGRLTNSTQDVLEKRLAALEGGVAVLALASGAAAIIYVEALAQKGEHIVAQKTIYGGSYNLLAHTLPNYGVDTTFVDIHNLYDVTAAIRTNTKAIFIETLGNPNSDISDIDAIAQIARRIVSVYIEMGDLVRGAITSIPVHQEAGLAVISRSAS